MAKRRSGAGKYRPKPAVFRIAVVDDDPGIRELLRGVLAGEGFECLLAPDGASGLKACRAAKPDLILLDVHLPDANGIELCRSMKADETLRHIPILIMTGEAVPGEERVEGLEAGADDYILKPFDVPELVSRIRGILRTSLRPTEP